MSQLPDDIRAAMLKAAKSWVIGNYVCGGKRLSAWSDHYAHLISIRSFELPGGTAHNLRRLVKLSKAGVLVERPRYRKNIGARTFAAHREVTDQIGFEAIAHWQRLGYVVGEMMEMTEAHKAQHAQAQEGQK